MFHKESVNKRHPDFPKPIFFGTFSRAPAAVHKTMENAKWTTIFLLITYFYAVVLGDSTSFSVPNSGIGSYDSLYGSFNINNDAYHEIVIGAPALKQAYVFFGASGPPSLTNPTILSGTSTSYGWSFASGDLNGDTYDELLVGSQDYVYVYYGSSTGFNFASNFTFTAAGASASSVYFGYQVAVGDYNGDSYKDVAISAVNYTNGQTNEGAVFFYTNAGYGFTDSPSFIRESNFTNAFFGSSMEFGKINGDVYADLIAGMPGYTGTQTSQGGVLVFYGSSSGPQASGYQMTAPSAVLNARYGTSVCSGDINGDGIGDVCAGSPGQSARGNIYCYQGTNGANPSYWTASANMGAAAGVSLLGSSVACLGRVNADAYEEIFGGSISEGHGYAGLATGPNPSPPPFYVISNSTNQFLVAAAGDFDADGVRDILVANPQTAFLHYNVLASPSTTPSRTPSRTPTPSVTPSISPSVTPSVTPSVSPSASVTPTETPSPSITPSVTPTPSITPTVSPTPSVSPSESVTPSGTPSNTPTPSPTSSTTPTSSVTPSPSVTPSTSSTPSVTPSITPTPSVTPSPSLTPSVTPSITPTPSVTSSITPTPSVTPSITPTPSVSMTPGASTSPSSTPSSSTSSTPTSSATPSVTPTPSISPSNTPTPSVTPTASPTPSVTPSSQPSTSPTPTPQNEDSKKKKGNGAVVGIAVGVSGAGLLCAGAVGFFLVRRRKKNDDDNLDVNGSLERVESVPGTPDLPPNYVAMHRVGSVDSTTSLKASNNNSTIISNSDFDKRWEIPYPEITIGKQIGNGAFGTVYKAEWRNCDCVVKQLNLERTDSKAIADFLKEAKTVRNLRNHKNVCTIFGVCLDPEYPICIVMEYVSGGSLYNLVIRDDIPFEALTIVRFCKDITGGMSHIHKENILHCDLAARNLLVEKSNNRYVVKVTDFGLSRVSESGTYNASSAAVFPVRWSAPEVIEKLQVSRASDVWSFGVVMWEILEGKQPYYGMTNPEVVEYVCQKKLLLGKPSRFDYPPRLWQIAQSCWKWVPDERPTFEDLYKQFTEMEAEIKAGAAEEDNHSSPIQTSTSNSSNGTLYGNKNMSLSTSK